MEHIQKLSTAIRQGHQAIKESIAAVQLAVRSYRQARPALYALEEVLTAHLKRQDQALFDELNGFYAENRQDFKMLEFLHHDLKDMRIKTLIFYDKYPNAAVTQEGRGLPQDFGKFTVDILGRIRAEEEYLLPLMSRLITEP